MCPWCVEGSTTFLTDAAFRDHIASRHNTSFSEAEMSLITKSNQRSQPFECCLICGLSDGLPDGREGTPKTAAGRQIDIISCMVNHSEVLALESIPWHIGDMGDARSDEAEDTDTIVAAAAEDATEAGYRADHYGSVGGMYGTDPSKNAEDSEISGDLDPIREPMHQGDLGSITSSAAPAASLEDRIKTWFAQDALEEPLSGSARGTDEPDINKPDELARKRHKADTPEKSPTRKPNGTDSLQAYLAWISQPRLENTGVDDFVPAGEVEVYLRHHAALEDMLLTLFPNTSDRPSARQILQTHSTVFTVLISCGKGDWINVFLKHESLCDNNLPFRMQVTGSQTEDLLRETYKIPAASAPVSKLSTESTSSRSLDEFFRNSFERFQASQARFCAPFLTEGYCYEFQEDDILPYLEKQLIGEGGGAKVYRVKVHASHDSMRRLNAHVRFSRTAP